MNEIIPKTKKECFALLNEMLSEEDKQAIIESKDVMSSILVSACGYETIGYIPKAKKKQISC